MALEHQENVNRQEAAPVEKGAKGQSEAPESFNRDAKKLL